MCTQSIQMMQDKERAQSLATNTASSLFDYPLEEALIGPYIMDEYKPELITALLDTLRPDNMNMAVISQTYSGRTSETERWYGTEYNRVRIDSVRVLSACSYTCSPLFRHFLLPLRMHYDDGRRQIPSNYPNVMNLFRRISNCIHANRHIYTKSEHARLWRAMRHSCAANSTCRDC
jgi:hypothetical protein